MTRATITLTTDFADDFFAGVMKGVIARINPEATVIDLTHAVPPGDVRAGAFAVMAGSGYFPAGTIHVVVVDPGVGSARRILCVRTAAHTFLAPDNGILTWTLRRHTQIEIRAVENRRYFLDTVSRTFHARDIFAPVAAHLSLGASLSELGPPVDPESIARLDFPEPQTPTSGLIHGEILYVDRFGNCITNIGADMLEGVDPASVEVRAGPLRISGLRATYSAAASGSAVALVGSTGFLEIAAAGASAARRFGLKVGDPVSVGR